MTDLRSRFNTWYFNEFHQTELFDRMYETVEDSPWHRELNVGVHVDMVVGQYVGMSPREWDRKTLLGAFAVAFHDTGKPAAEDVQESEERGVYRRYTGHELISTRIWENYAVVHWEQMVELFGLVPKDIYNVGWAIEHHLPYGIKKADKVTAMVRSATETVGAEVFSNVLESDTLGKICDDHEEKIETNQKWRDDFFSNTYDIHLDFTAPTCHVLIGASGSGKSSYVVNNLTNSHVYSWDMLRTEWYGSPDCPDESLSAVEEYRLAFERSCDDPEFKNRCNKNFMDVIKTGTDIVVDNINISNKRRKFFCNEAHRHGYRVVAVLFPIALDTLIERQDSRTDKMVPTEAVIRHYQQLQYPFYGDFDEVIVTDGNL